MEQLAERLQAVRLAWLTRDFSGIAYDTSKHPRDSHGRYIGGDHGMQSIAHRHEVANLKTWLAEQKAFAKTLPTVAAQRAHLKGLTYQDAKGQRAITAHIKQLLATADTHAGQLTKSDVTKLAATVYALQHYHVDPEMQQHFLSTIKTYNAAQTDPVTKVATNDAGLFQSFNAVSSADAQFITSHALFLAPKGSQWLDQGPRYVLRLAVADKKVVKGILGRQFTNDDVQKLFPGTQIVGQLVRVSTSRTPKQLPTLEVKLGAKPGDAYVLKFSITREGNAVTAYIDWATNTLESPAYAGRVIIRAMQHFQSMGVTRINALAFGEYDQFGTMNGYYTWPRLGFDGPIPIDTRSEARARFPGVKSVGDIMTKPGGAAWWKQNGSEFHATFDFTPGSYSMQVFDRLSQAIVNRVHLAQLRRRLLVLQEVG